MPITNLIDLHLTQAEKTALDNALVTIQNTLAPKCRNLTPDERRVYGSINELNKLLIAKVRDYRTTQPGMSSADVDWTEFEADYQDRNYLELFLARLATLAEMAEDTKKLHDYDVYQAALTDYDYTKYKANTNSPGYDSKHEDIRQFFPNTGNSGSHTPPAGPAA